MVGTRLTPPSIQDGPFGYEPGERDGFDAPGDEENPVLSPAEAQKLARACYDASTNWLNSGRRAAWADSLRAFQSLHPSGSKYLSTDYRYRSSLYRPKTRAMVRKAEAQTAAAFFSNEDVVSVSAQDEDDPQQLASAEIMKELLQYRLTHTIPWFLTVTGARQDGEVQGICIAKAHWNYEERKTGTIKRPVPHPVTGEPLTDPETGEAAFELIDQFEKVTDEPAIDLIAPENFRFEPGADWRDPVKTSPYIIELIPTYISEAREKMKKGEWHKIAESALRSATDIDDDATRRSRENGRVPGKDSDAWKPRDFDICWVRENIVKWGGRDWHYYTMGSAGELLTDPRPLEEVYLTGERPYVVGFIVVETHKTYPSSKVELVRDLQRAANDTWNLRFDNVKLALNPRQFVQTGAGVEIQDVRTFMPGKVVMMNKPPAETITWDRPPEVTESAYAEQDRINLDFDEIAGDFSNTSVQSTQMIQQSATGMNLMSGIASGMNEYELRVFAETFIEKVIRLLVKLEQAYETDPVVLAMAGKKAQLLQRFGIGEITDHLLQQELTIKTNVGIGATNPQLKLRNFVAAAEILGKLFGPAMVQGVNFEEVSKEIMGLAGYKDGERFFKPGFDPRVTALQAELQKLQGKDKSDAPQAPDNSKVQAAQITAQGKIQERQIAAQSDQTIAQLDYQRAMMEEQGEMQRATLAAQREIATMPHPALQGLMPRG